jgi:hypothetical protein
MHVPLVWLRMEDEKSPPDTTSTLAQLGVALLITLATIYFLLERF